MSLSDYITPLDRFELDENEPIRFDSRFCFPCCVCKHNAKDWAEPPCIHCDHNANAEPVAGGGE